MAKPTVETTERNLEDPSIGPRYKLVGRLTQLNILKFMNMLRIIGFCVMFALPKPACDDYKIQIIGALLIALYAIYQNTCEVRMFAEPVILLIELLLFFLELDCFDSSWSMYLLVDSISRVMFWSCRWAYYKCHECMLEMEPLEGTNQV